MHSEWQCSDVEDTLRVFAEALIAAHNDAGVGHLSEETQRLLAGLYQPARQIVDERRST